ncbi:MAG: ATP-binding cassette domain-containing protein [Cyclobacteriaceae bacterium]
MNEIDLIIPHGKVTAIVGSSGSGKTTLMKLLLKFFNPINRYTDDYCPEKT